MRVKQKYFIAHVCLNSRLLQSHPDYCNTGFIDEASTRHTCSEQCWKYCPKCEAEGFPKITEKTILETNKLRTQKIRDKQELL